jgi:hypothetical protein
LDRIVVWVILLGSIVDEGFSHNTALHLEPAVGNLSD